MFKLAQVRQNVTRWLLVLAFAAAVGGPILSPTPIFANGGCTTSSGSCNGGG